MKQAEIKNLSVEDIKAKLVELRATFNLDSVCNIT